MRGTLNSTPNAIFRVEFFANEKANATRYGDGQRYLGAIMVGTDSDGNADIIATLAAVSTGQFISATATRPGYNTSEFSQVVEVNPTTAAHPRAARASWRRPRTRTTCRSPARRSIRGDSVIFLRLRRGAGSGPGRRPPQLSPVRDWTKRSGRFVEGPRARSPLRDLQFVHAHRHAHPEKSLASGLFFKVVVDGTSAHGVSDTTGRLIDGNGDGQPGGDYVVVFARGKALSYRDRDGDVVSIKLRGGGVLELSQSGGRDDSATSSRRMRFRAEAC